MNLFLNIIIVWALLIVLVYILSSLFTKKTTPVLWEEDVKSEVWYSAKTNNVYVKLVDYNCFENKYSTSFFTEEDIETLSLEKVANL